jgi:hypothetical protein
VRVEVIEIQIYFEFKLICNLQNRFEKEKKEFLNGKSAFRPAYHIFPTTCSVPTISVLNLAIFPMLLKPVAQKLKKI